VANRFIEGFEQYPTGALTAEGAGGRVVGGFAGVSIIDPGRGGFGKQILVSGTGVPVLPVPDMATDEFYLGFAVTILGSQPGRFLRLSSAGNASACNFETTADQQIRAFYGTTTILVTSGAPIVEGAEVYIEIEGKLTVGTDGWMNLYADGVLVGSMSGARTTAWTPVRLDHLRLDRLGNNTHVRFDDIYVNDGSGTRMNGLLGDRRVAWRPVAADDTPQDWTPDTGTEGFSRINEPNDASFIASSTTGHRSMFTPAPSTAAEISAANVLVRGYKEESGPGNLAIVTDAGNGAVVGAPRALGSGPWWHNQRLELNPATGNPWTAAEVNALRLGVEIV
jgi:hypothetical protein